ncbi:MAG: RecQ family ATP-dependent DNA helicase [Flavobacteriaceae bacterium]
MNLPLQILERYWKFSKFRPQQQEIIQSVLNQQDCVALLPTGGGKSLCFQIPALINDGLCIVVSPLIALMQDQVNALNNKDIKATALTNLNHLSDLERILDNCVYGNYKFLYLSPERLQNPLVQERIKLMNVNLIAVDEAHCISQWGHDFRPAYRSINKLKTLHPKVTTIALTASATKRVVEDIKVQLNLEQPKIFRHSFYRENLSYQSLLFEDKDYKIIELLKQNKESAIVYTGSRSETQQLAKMLNNNGISSGYYHGGLNAKEKEQHYQQWISDETKVIVATNAFGMGIDKADVSMVIHINIPESLEHYFQEAGRAGRNQKEAKAILLVGPNDIEIAKKWYIDYIPDIDFLKLIYKKLCTYFQIAYGEMNEEKHGLNFNTFCNLYELSKRKTYNGLKVLDRHGLIVFEELFRKKTSLQFLVNHNVLIDQIKHNDELRLMMTTILRTYEGIHSQETSIDIEKIAKILNIEASKIIQNLDALAAKEIVKFRNINTDAQITFSQPREDEKAINRISKEVKVHNKIKYNKIVAVINYIENNSVCKSKQLLTYFDEPNSKACGICNVCIKKENAIVPFKKENVDLVLKSIEVKPMTSRMLESNLSISNKEVVSILKHLLELRKIEQTQTNKFQIKCP